MVFSNVTKDRKGQFKEEVCNCPINRKQDFQSHTDFINSNEIYLQPITSCGRGFPGGTMIENPPANTEDAGEMDWIPRLGRSPENGMTAHSRILAWKSPGTEEPGGLQSVGSQRVGHD